jgi:uncharacterized protein YgiM (DUF1202 family)
VATPSETTTNLKLVVTSTELNVRFGPGSEYQVLETLTLGDQVNYISKKGEWILVKTDAGTKGYVYYKFVKFVE